MFLFLIALESQSKSNLDCPNYVNINRIPTAPFSLTLILS